MRKLVGFPFIVLGYISGAIFGIWGLIIQFAILYKLWGFIGIVLSLIVLPVALYATPWYELIANQNIAPILVIYGGSVLTLFFYFVGHAIIGKE